MAKTISYKGYTFLMRVDEIPPTADYTLTQYKCALKHVLAGNFTKPLEEEVVPSYDVLGTVAYLQQTAESFANKELGISPIQSDLEKIGFTKIPPPPDGQQ